MGIKKHTIPFFFVCFLSFGVSGQSKKDVIASKMKEKDLAVLNERISSFVKKEKMLKGRALDFYFVHNFLYQGKMTKEDFLSGSFINKLTPAYYKLKGVEYLTSQVRIKDEKNEVIAYGDYRFITVSSNCLSCQRELSLLVKNEMDFIFYIYQTNSSVYIGIKEDRIFAVNETGSEFEILPFKDYIERNWENYAASSLLPDTDFPLIKTKLKKAGKN